jgi:hypothetical protein
MHRTRRQRLGFISVTTGAGSVIRSVRHTPPLVNPYSYKVSLTVLHPVIEPTAITSTLGIQPNDSHRAGDPRRTPTGSPLGGVYDRSFWRHSFSPPDDSDLPAFLHRVAATLQRHREFFRSLRETGGDTELFVGLFSEGTNIGATIAHDLMAVLADLSIDIGLDIYAYNDEEITSA